MEGRTCARKRKKNDVSVINDEADSKEKIGGTSLRRRRRMGKETSVKYKVENGGGIKDEVAEGQENIGRTSLKRRRRRMGKEISVKDVDIGSGIKDEASGIQDKLGRTGLRRRRMGKETSVKEEDNGSVIKDEAAESQYKIGRTRLRKRRMGKETSVKDEDNGSVLKDEAAERSQDKIGRTSVRRRRKNTETSIRDEVENGSGIKDEAKGEEKISRISLRRRKSNGTSIEDEVDNGDKIIISISELPYSILIDILSRLPLKTIFHCSCVCKTWLNLLRDHDFAKAHVMRAPTSLILRPRKPKSKGKLEDLFLMVDLEAKDICHRNARMKLSSDLNFPTSWGYTVVNSCNGFICLSDGAYDNPAYILNPVTGDYVTIPPVQMRHWRSISWFGFCAMTDQYKVLRVFPQTSLLHSKMEAEVYTVGTASWRKVGDNLDSIYISRTSMNGSLHYDSFLNGSVHCVVDDPNSCEFICSFHFTNETFKPVPPPSPFGPDHKQRAHGMSLGVFGDSLCMGYYSSLDQYDIWTMKEYGIQESWSKLFIIKTPSTSYLQDFYLPLKSVSDLEILMLRNHNALVSYNIGENTIYNFKIRGTGSEFEEIFSHIPSFISFKRIGMGENLEVSNVKQR